MCEAALESILEGRRSRPHQLIEVLQDVQDHYGHIPEDAMKTVSAHLGVPLIEVFRVANFYKAFSLTPRGKNVITICTGTACHVRGAGLLVDQVKGQLKLDPGETTADGMVTIEGVNCLGACALGPVVVENGTYRHHVTPGKLRRRIERIQHGSDAEGAGDEND